MDSKKPLSGHIVIDLSQNLPGPYCASLLQQKGARVVKIESPQKPDPAKFLPRLYSILNNNKDVRHMDFTMEPGRTEFLELVKTACIVIEGARPGVAKKLGIDFESLKLTNPNIIYCSISGYGQNSSKNGVPAHDINLQAESGLMSLCTSEKTPTFTPIPIADLTASHLAYSEILNALILRTNGQTQGQFIDISMGHSLNHMVEVWQQSKVHEADILPKLDKSIWTRFADGINPLRQYVLKAATAEPLSRLPHYGVFKGSDGRPFCIGIVDEKHFWIALCDCLGGILRRFRHSDIKSRLVFSPFFRMLIRHRLRRKPTSYWLEVLRDLPVSEVV